LNFIEEIDGENVECVLKTDRKIMGKEYMHARGFYSTISLAFSKSNVLLVPSKGRKFKW
jgi:hypothetical protein